MYIPDQRLSIEVKTSGQAAFKVYGNRSYGQKPETELLAKKEKSGFYLTVNFFRQALTLLRFGWIDEEDWKPQKSETGQMAGLRDSVYSGKLVAIPGVYRRQAPIQLLKGVGPKTQAEFGRYQITTVGELLTCATPLPARLEKIKAQNQPFLEGCS